MSVTIQSALQREYSSVVGLNSYGHPEDAVVKAYDQHTLYSRTKMVTYKASAHIFFKVAVTTFFDSFES